MRLTFEGREHDEAVMQRRSASLPASGSTTDDSSTTPGSAQPRPKRQRSSSTTPSSDLSDDNHQRFVIRIDRDSGASVRATRSGVTIDYGDSEIKRQRLSVEDTIPEVVKRNSPTDPKFSFLGAAQNREQRSNRQQKPAQSGSGSMADRSRDNSSKELFPEKTFAAIVASGMSKNEWVRDHKYRQWEVEKDAVEHGRETMTIPRLSRGVEKIVAKLNQLSTRTNTTAILGKDRTPRLMRHKTSSRIMIFGRESLWSHTMTLRPKRR